MDWLAIKNWAKNNQIRGTGWQYQKIDGTLTLKENNRVVE
jgi:hypothetical protein